MTGYVGAIDQGTTSTRFMVFDRAARVVASEQREHEQICPRPGWVEHDPREIWRRTDEAIAGALQRAGLRGRDLAAVGIANQRETTVLWDRATGEPALNAIVWQDTRTAGLVDALAAGAGLDRLRAATGLPLSTYFSGPKLTWALQRDAELRARAEAGELRFGTVDSFLLAQLTGGAHHITDATNASRTLLMDLRTLAWHEPSLELMGIPRALLPEIRSSSEVYGEATATAIAGVPIAGVLGDQQAALFGQACFCAGEAKCTYGTGSFLLVNTGSEPVGSRELLATVAYRLGDAAPAYALEAAIAVTGAAVQWLRDRLGVIETAGEIEALAASVPDTGDVYFVPAFSGLFAPRWRADARGAIVGLTAYATRAHLARATLEATAWQTREAVDAVRAAAGVELAELRVDGGMTVNDLLMALQADLLGTPVIRPAIAETTCLGAAYAAGLAVGFWSGLDELRANWREDRRWTPRLGVAEREARYARWRQAVERSLNWA